METISVSTTLKASSSFHYLFQLEFESSSQNVIGNSGWTGDIVAYIRAFCDKTER